MYRKGTQDDQIANPSKRMISRSVAFHAGNGERSFFLFTDSSTE